MDARELKDKAAQLFSKGKYAKAAEQYEAYCKLDPKDVQTRLRLGDAWVKAGEKAKAVKAYTWAAEGFAKDGFLPRAIAASKLVLEVDPTHTAVQQMLADLYSRKSTAARPAAAPHEAPVTKRPTAIELPPEDPKPAEVIAAPVPPPAPLPPPPDLDFSMVTAPAAEPAPVTVDVEEAPATVEGVAIEVDEGVHSGEVEVPIEAGVELELTPPTEAPPPAAPAEAPAPAAAPTGTGDYTLADLAGDFQVVSSPAEIAALASGGSATAEPKVFTLDDEPGETVEAVEAEEVTPSAPSVEAPAAATLVVDASEPEMSLEDALAAASAAVEKAAAPAEVAPVVKPPPSAPPGLKAKSSASVPAVAKPTGAAAGPSAFEASLNSLVKFDPPSIAPLAPVARAPSSFTELEFDGDSLLHSVELAAAKSVSLGAVPPPPPMEETPEAPEEAHADASGLPKIPLFSDLPHDAFIALFEQCPLRRFEPGDRILEQGTTGESFFVICAGKVRVFRDAQGKRIDLAVIDEGNFFGEVALLSDAPRTASVEAAAEDTQLLEISAATLTALSKQHPTIATALKKFCRQRLLSNLMASAAIFAPFTKNERRDLIQKFKAREVVPGDVVLKAGIPSDGLYLVLSGEVEIVVDAKTIASLREGEVFGEMSLLTRSPASATVKARRRTSLLRLPRDDFDKLIMSHPQILEMVAELTDARKKQNAALTAKTNATGDMV